MGFSPRGVPGADALSAAGESLHENRICCSVLCSHRCRTPRLLFGAGDVDCNSAESYFSLLKRGIHGSFHHDSKTHFPRYCDEFAFRWNYRKVTDGEREESALRSASGDKIAISVVTYCL